MPDNHPRIIKNSLSKSCRRCTGVHEYITRLTEDARCDTPVAFSLEVANKISRIVARGADDVIKIPDDTLVVMDESARKLPREGSRPLKLAQFETVIR